MEALQFVVANWDAVALVITSAISLASLITAATPTPRPDSWLGRAYRVVEVVGLVVGKTKESGLVPPAKK